MAWISSLVVIEILCIVTVHLQVRKDPMKIGVILDEKAGRQKILSFAWDYYTQDMEVTNTKFHPADVIDLSNNHKLITSFCAKVAEGAMIMIVDNNPVTYSSVKSYAHSLHVPTVVPGGTGFNSYDQYRYDVSLLPTTIDAIVALIKLFEWNNVVYYLFDTNDGLLRLQRLYESFKHGEAPTIRAHRISNVSDCYEILRKIDKENLPKRIILDLTTRMAFESILHQVVDVGMNREGYHYILGGLGINELDLAPFVYGGVNITGFSIVDNVSPENVHLIGLAHNFTLHSVRKITVDEALVIDSVHVLLQAAKNLMSDIYTARTKDRNRYYRVGNTDSACCNCSGDALVPTFDGEMVLSELKSVKTYGLTGNIEFDDKGVRQDYIFRVHHLELKRPLREVGFWTPKDGFNTSLPVIPKVKRPMEALNRTLRVVTIKEEPFVQFKTSSDHNGAPMVDGRYLEGFCIDLAQLVKEQCASHYDYYIDFVGDNKYGLWHKDSGCWDGVIGELIDTDACPYGGTRKKADIAIAPLTINEVRQRVVDFTKPFMKTGISIMIKKPDKEKPGVFSFMYPLSNIVWLCVMVGFVAVSLVLFLVGRWSPYEWTDTDLKGAPINNFNLLNTFWFSLGALMQQGSDTFPRSYSGRIVGSAWWFFTLILISSYTANLAAFLTIERLLPPVKSVDDLVRKQREIEYGTLSSGSSRQFFEESNVDIYKKMWQFMGSNADRVLVKNNLAGVEKVRNGKGKYAFLLESAFNLYHNQRKPCNTMKVGNNLDHKGYGIATPPNFKLTSELNLAVLKLREVGELIKLEEKWWYSKGECGTEKKDASTSALTLSNVAGVFHILVGGLVFAMLVALIEYLIHHRIKISKQKERNRKLKPQTVRIVKKEPLEALKEAGYSEREHSTFSGYSSAVTSAASASLATFDSSRYGQT